MTGIPLPMDPMANRILHFFKKIPFSFRGVAVILERLVLYAILTCFLVYSAIPPSDKVEQIRAFTRQIEFDFISWTVQAIAIKWEQNTIGSDTFIAPDTRSELVLSYLDLVRNVDQVEADIQKIYADPNVSDPQTAAADKRAELKRLVERRNSLAPFVETAVQTQLSQVLAEMGLTLAGQPAPPVLYHVTELPNTLIVSPRDVIREDASIMIDPDMNLSDIVHLEEGVAKKMNVSTLVEEIGGVGLYPTMVMQVDDVTALTNVVAHEWTHNFLTLHPLGLTYDVSPEMRTINETTASIAGNEISLIMTERFYPQKLPPPASPPPAQSEQQSKPAVFNFNKEMHQTRVTTDRLLEEGKIKEAEDYMEMRRRFLWEHGYSIRKLNQAYFAFHGAYADQPEGAAGKDPVGEAVRALRNQSPSLAAFLNRIAWMGSLEQLMEAVKRP